MKEILEMIIIDSNTNFINNSFINDIIILTKSNTSNLLQLYKSCSQIIGSMKKDYKIYINSDEIHYIKWLLNNNEKEELEVILLAF